MSRRPAGIGGQRACARPGSTSEPAPRCGALLLAQAVGAGLLRVGRADRGRLRQEDTPRAATAATACWSALGRRRGAGQHRFVRTAERLGLLTLSGDVHHRCRYVGFAAAPTLSPGQRRAAVGGMGNGVQWAPLISAVQTLTPEALQGRVMGAWNRSAPSPGDRPRARRRAGRAHLAPRRLPVRGAGAWRPVLRASAADRTRRLTGPPRRPDAGTRGRAGGAARGELGGRCAPPWCSPQPGLCTLRYGEIGRRGPQTPAMSHPRLTKRLYDRGDRLLSAAACSQPPELRREDWHPPLLLLAVLMVWALS